MPPDPLLRWVKVSSECIVHDTEVCEVSLSFANVSLQFTGTEWLPCDSFLALLAVLWALVCTV